MRVSTPYSDTGKGQLFVPEVGSQVLVGYEQGQAEFLVVLGNLFHAQNPQQATYTTPRNHLKGLQTAGGDKLVMSDVAGAPDEGEAIKKSLLSLTEKAFSKLLLLARYTHLLSRVAPFTSILLADITRLRTIEA